MLHHFFVSVQVREAPKTPLWPDPEEDLIIELMQALQRCPVSDLVKPLVLDWQVQIVTAKTLAEGLAQQSVTLTRIQQDKDRMRNEKLIDGLIDMDRQHGGKSPAAWWLKPIWPFRRSFVYVTAFIGWSAFVLMLCWFLRSEFFK